jgi:hypothetical protein
MSGRAAVLTAFILLSACAHKPTTALAPRAAGQDSIVGVVAVTGASPRERIELRSGNRSTPLNPADADARALKRLSGVEIVARGTAASSGFSVTSFTALRADGQPVFDGFVRRAPGGGYVLETTGGARLAVASPPPAFATLVGARVWLGGSLATGPNVYGVIIPPP